MRETKVESWWATDRLKRDTNDASTAPFRIIIINKLWLLVFMIKNEPRCCLFWFINNKILWETSRWRACTIWTPLFVATSSVISFGIVSEDTHTWRKGYVFKNIYGVLIAISSFQKYYWIDQLRKSDKQIRPTEITCFSNIPVCSVYFHIINSYINELF